MDHQFVYQCVNCKVYGKHAEKHTYDGEEYYELIDHPEPRCAGSGIWDVVVGRLLAHKLMHLDYDSVKWECATGIERQILQHTHHELFENRTTLNSGKTATGILGGREFNCAFTTKGSMIVYTSSWVGRRLFTGRTTYINGDYRAFQRDMTIARMFLNA